jgi:hypothetical protein
LFFAKNTIIIFTSYGFGQFKGWISLFIEWSESSDKKDDSDSSEKDLGYIMIGGSESDGEAEYIEVKN